MSRPAQDHSFRLELGSDVSEIARAAFVALTHAAWLRFLTHVEGAELRAEVLCLPPPDPAWQKRAAYEAFAIIGAALPSGDPFREALERYAAEAIPKLLAGGAPPAPTVAFTSESAGPASAPPA